MILNDEDKLLIRKAEDKMRIADENYMLTSTGFLSDREQSVLSENIKPLSPELKILFFGGYDDSLRRTLVFLPEYLDLYENSPICALRASYYRDYELSHRDFLGAILGLGLSRDAVGDILVDKTSHSADIIIKNEIKDFLLSEFKTAGRATVTLKEIPFSSLNIPAERTITITDTVASPRIDSIASSGFGISREKAVTLIKSGNVFVNRVICTSPDRSVPDGATVNASGYGKFKVYITGNTSKKGRLFIKIEKYN